METMNNEQFALPMIPLRGLNVFPGMFLTFEVERASSLGALGNALNGDRLIFLAAQTDMAEDVPEGKDIYSVGVVCRIRQQLRVPRGNGARLMVEGLYRAEALSIVTDPDGYSAVLRALPDKKDRIAAERLEALMRNALSLFEEYIHLNSDMLPEQILDVVSNPKPAQLAFYIAQNVRLSVDDKQKILEELQPSKRLALLGKLLNNELNILTIEKELNEATQEEINRNQREYFLHEEMKLIRSELGEDVMDDVDLYREKIESLPVSDEIREKLLKEVNHLSKQPFGSSEASVIRSYLDTCLELPWGVKTQETIDIVKARKILDSDHYGLDKVKERIIEYLAVKQLSPEVKGGLLCLVGPPGTGKTSVAMSIARATNRKLVRIALGGVHDEAEIRGHRKTYVGSMPGRIINGVIQSGSCNPLMVLDEIDKLGSDYRGDPAAALLEALDGEQNSKFRDNFLEIPFDLSEIFFITTANTTDTIPRALLDRMEVIELSSYTDEEKLQIARRHLLPKQRKKHGLNGASLKITDDAIRRMIVSYTRESGVRVLEREIARVCRKTAAGIASGTYRSLTLTPSKIEAFLGPEKYKSESLLRRDEVGLVRGLAWTSVGGETLDVEVSAVEGTGKIEMTGNLGNVMKESVSAAITFIRSRAKQLGIASDFYKTMDIHIHFPEGAVPKDGPSAGITVCIAVISALTGMKVRHDVAMTGEITLRGRVLAIGGLKEKTMAALRNGVRTVIIPQDNVTDLEEIDQTVRSRLEFFPVSCADEAIRLALIPSGLDAAASQGQFSQMLQDAVRQ
ncbi:MAG: endopeptidase La [Oscillospiraceae bacterium]|nr:endopeptidase La [Oscillospiraceae bacterium]